MLDFEKVKLTLQSNNKLRLKNIPRLLDWQTTGKEITHGEALVYWIDDYLQQQGFLSHDQLDLIMSHFGKIFQIHGDYLEENKNTFVVKHLMIADRFWVTCNGSDYFVNLLTGDSVKELKSMAIVVTHYNFTQLYTKRMKELGKR